MQRIVQILQIRKTVQIQAIVRILQTVQILQMQKTVQIQVIAAMLQTNTNF